MRVKEVMININRTGCEGAVYYIAKLCLSFLFILLLLSKIKNESMCTKKTKNTNIQITVTTPLSIIQKQ